MTSVVAVVALAGQSEDGDEVEEDDWMDLARARAATVARAATASRMTKDLIFSKSSDEKENDADAREEAATRAATRGSMRDGYAACGIRARCGDGGRSDVRWETFAWGSAASSSATSSAKSESAKMTVTRGAEEAAALACETLNSVSSSAIASASARAVVDVVWFAPSAGRDASSGEETRYADAGEWTPAMVAAYGVFRRAKSLFGEFARARVVSCGRGRVSRGARAVAEAAGVSVTTLDGDETVDLAERWRGSLVFAPAKGNERIEIEGLRLSAMELDLSYGSKRVATNDAAFGGHRTNADETPLSSALRVVEIVRAGDIPSVYLSAVPPLRLRMDDVPQSRALRESLFSSWSEAAARAQTPGDAPAMVVKSQWRMKASGNYRDFADDEFSTPLLLYPVRQRRDDEGTTAMEFHLRPLASVPELVRRLSVGAGASGLNRSNVNIDNMSRLARIRALEEADEALNRLSDRQSVKLDDIIARDDVSARDADDEIFEDAEANLEPMDANFSPEIGAVKSSKLHSAVTAASRGARSNAVSDACAEYAQLWTRCEARHRFLCPTDVDGVGQKSGSTINSADAYSFKLDDIVDRLMEFNDTNVSSRLGGHVDGVEGFYTETFAKSIDIALSELDQNVAQCTILQDDDGREVGGIGAESAVEEAAKTFHQLICETDENTRNQRRAERIRQIEEKREKTFLALGIRRPLSSSSNKESAQRMDHRRLKEPTASLSQQRFDDVVSAEIVCPGCARVLQRPSSNILKFCYECGTKLT